MNRPAPISPRLCLLLLLATACAPKEPSPFPTDRPLVRLDGDWLAPPPGVIGDRTAPATVLLLRGNGELVELHGWLYGKADESPRISMADGYAVALGRWEHEGSEVRARRERVHHSAPVAGNDPLCAKPGLDFEILEGSLLGDAGVGTVGVYAPSDLPSSEVELYAGEVKRLGRPCG